MPSKYRSSFALPEEYRAYFGGQPSLALNSQTKAGLREKEIEAVRAIAKLAESIAGSNAGRAITLEGARRLWIDTEITPVKTKGEVKSICCFAKKLDPLAKEPLAGIRPSDLQGLLNCCPLSKRSLVRFRSVMKNFFSWAVEQRYLDRSPAGGLKIRIDAKVEKRMPITKEELAALDAARHKMRAAALIGAYAGLRRGEVIALTWGDIDLDRGVISVTKAAALKGGKPVVKAPKSKSGIRDVAILPQLRPGLEELGEEAGWEGHVIPMHDGLMMSLIAWRRAWASYTKTLGHEITFHQLRHTYASLLYEAGVDPKTIANQLGHATADISLNRYTTLGSDFYIKQINTYFNSKSD